MMISFEERTTESTPIVVRSDSLRIQPTEWSDAFRRISLHKMRASAVMEAGFWAAMAQEIRTAQVFDFGDVEDVKLREEAKRGGKLWNEGFLRMPFRSCIFWYEHRADPEIVTNPLLLRQRYCTVAVEVPSDLAGIMRKAEWRDPIVLIADFLRAEEFRGGNKVAYMLASACVLGCSDKHHLWHGRLIESLARDPTTEQAARFVGSMADGVVGLSMVLATKGVPMRHDDPSPQLNAKRERSGKPPMTRVTFVNTHAYYEAVKNTAAKGTHASPVPHLRRGHIRTYKDGHRVWIKDMLVNAKSYAELGNRDHYEVTT